MEYGEQCVVVTGITMTQELCADSWDMMPTQVKVNIWKNVVG